MPVKHVVEMTEVCRDDATNSRDCNRDSNGNELFHRMTLFRWRCYVERRSGRDPWCDWSSAHSRAPSVSQSMRVEAVASPYLCPTLRADDTGLAPRFCQCKPGASDARARWFHTGNSRSKSLWLPIQIHIQ